MQGVVGAALNRQHELRDWCAASASRSSAEAASSVLSTSPKSWIMRVGRGNSSTRQFVCVHGVDLQMSCARQLKQNKQFTVGNIPVDFWIPSTLWSQIWNNNHAFSFLCSCWLVRTVSLTREHDWATRYLFVSSILQLVQPGVLPGHQAVWPQHRTDVLQCNDPLQHPTYWHINVWRFGLRHTVFSPSEEQDSQPYWWDESVSLRRIQRNGAGLSGRLLGKFSLCRVWFRVFPHEPNVSTHSNFSLWQAKVRQQVWVRFPL